MPTACRADGCNQSAVRRLPDRLKFLGVSLCAAHVEQITLAVDAAMREVGDFGNEMERLIILREAQALTFPNPNSTPRLIVILGGSGARSAP